MDKKSALNPETYSAVKKFEQLARHSGLIISATYIFGSHAKGATNKWSDIDVAVVSPSFGKDRQGERVKLMSLSQKVNLDIEPHPFSPEDFDDPYYALAQEIKKTGVKV